MKRTGARLGWRHCIMPLAMLALSPTLTPRIIAQTAGTYHDRADQALQSFLLKFWKGDSQYLRNLYPSDGSLTGYWTYANGWDAVMDGIERTGGRQYYGFIESFYLGQNARGWYAGYYDDECWMTLALMRAYDLTGDVKYLNQAMALYADVMGGWDTTCCGAVKGGVWWDKAHTQKATAANAGAALAGARLYLRTGDPTYLDFSQQVYNYWYTNMVNSSTFQVCDHITTDGSKVWWRFTYNEGLMIGASVALNEATGNALFLTRAHNIASYMVNYETISTPYGPVLYDGDNAGCGGDCHEFKGPGYRYLMQLYTRDTRKTQYYSVLKASADAVWNLARNSTSTVFSVNWAGPPQATVDQGQDNAACMALNRFAQQYGTYPGPGVTGNQYEAENATLHNLGVEALYGAFTGWAYVAAWSANGQSVDFRVPCAAASSYTLAFRYAAGAGNASRLITVNGVSVFPNQSFANTGAWSAYSTNRLVVDLPAGTNLISVIYSSAAGSANYLNLDNLVVTDNAPEQIRFTSIRVPTNGIVRLTWTTRIGQTYRVQFRDGLAGGSWTDLGAPILAYGTTATVDDSVGAWLERYYRIAQP